MPYTDQTINDTIHKTSLEKILKLDMIYLSPIEEAARLVFLRRDRFVEGSYYLADLIKLLNEYFGSLKTLYDKGLQRQYSLLKTHIETKNCIGLILSGVNTHDKVINNYMRLGATNAIQLTVASLCRSVLRNNFSQLEIETLSKATPNYDLYFEHTKNNTFEKKGRFKVKSFVASPPKINANANEKSQRVIRQEANEDLDKVMFFD
jgi:hypothetical protein